MGEQPMGTVDRSDATPDEDKVLESGNIRRNRGRVLPGSGAALWGIGKKCGAKRRDGSGGLCRRVAAKGKPRCKLHGGGNGIGAPMRNQNALKHGKASNAAVAQRKLICAQLKVVTTLGVSAALFSPRVRPNPLRADQVQILAAQAPELLQALLKVVAAREPTGR